MKKSLTQEEKVAALTGAIGRADRELNLILEPMDHRTSERLLTVCRRVRKILRAALAKVEEPGKAEKGGAADGA
jgi:23S rRNA C2498 (ribose-2'-O)-methylase RlmM